MNDPSLKRLPAILVFLALAGLGASVTAGEKPAEPEGEESVERPANHLRWTTATEHENFGYDVYRAESEDGPFERINKDPILGAGTTDEPTSYEFVDSDIDPYQTYWYYLESISMTGVKERFTPIFRKKAKLSRDETEEGEDDPDS